MPDVVAHRVFAWDPGAGDAGIGGPLRVNRNKQGAGRHDSPESYGVYYCSTSPESAVAESIQQYRGQTITDSELTQWGLRLALVSVEFGGAHLLDLDEPHTLLELKTRPSRVASPQRQTTQAIARQVFSLNANGIRWWSTLNSNWTNLSIFTLGDRVSGKILEGPRIVTLDDPALILAAAGIGVRV